jgi:hypothetical protein
VCFNGAFDEMIMDRTSLDNAFERARQLPDAVQEVLAKELSDRIDPISRTALNAAQTDEIRRRLSDVPNFASDEEVRAFYADFGLEP